MTLKDPVLQIWPKGTDIGGIMHEMRVEERRGGAGETGMRFRQAGNARKSREFCTAGYGRLQRLNKHRRARLGLQQRGWGEKTPLPSAHRLLHPHVLRLLLLLVKGTSNLGQEGTSPPPRTREERRVCSGLAWFSNGSQNRGRKAK